MKLAKILLNFIYGVFVFCVICVLSCGTFAAVSYQTSDESARISFSETDSNVAFYDPLLYWKDDMTQNVGDCSVENTKLRVSNWFGWSWWKKVGGGADQYFVDPIVKSFRGIFMPLAETNDIMTYTDAKVSDFSDDLDPGTFKTMAASYFPDVTLKAVDTKDELRDELRDTGADELFSLESLVNNDNLTPLKDGTAKSGGNGVTDIYDFADQYPTYYNILFNLSKYNSKDFFRRWYGKYTYLTPDLTGTHIVRQADIDAKLATSDMLGMRCSRHIKSSVYCTNIMWFLTFIITLFFIWENPIDIWRNGDGHTEVGPMFSRHGKHRKSKGRDADDKEDKAQ